jgi:hypothetical protein
MRMRLVLGGVATALALGTVAPAQAAAPSITCAPFLNIVCVVVCRVSQPICAT